MSYAENIKLTGNSQLGQITNIGLPEVFIVFRKYIM